MLQGGFLSKTRVCCLGGEDVFQKEKTAIQRQEKNSNRHVIKCSIKQKFHSVHIGVSDDPASRGSAEARDTRDTPSKQAELEGEWGTKKTEKRESREHVMTGTAHWWKEVSVPKCRADHLCDFEGCGSWCPKGKARDWDHTGWALTVLTMTGSLRVAWIMGGRKVIPEEKNTTLNLGWDSYWQGGQWASDFCQVAKVSSDGNLLWG